MPLRPNEFNPAIRCRSEGRQATRTCSYLERHSFPVNMRVHRFEMQVLRYGFVLQREHDLDQPDDARCSFEMPYICLHRTDKQRVSRITVRTQRRRN